MTVWQVKLYMILLDLFLANPSTPQVYNIEMYCGDVAYEEDIAYCTKKLRQRRVHFDDEPTDRDQCPTKAELQAVIHAVAAAGKGHNDFPELLSLMPRKELNSTSIEPAGMICAP